MNTKVGDFSQTRHIWKNMRLPLFILILLSFNSYLRAQTNHLAEEALKDFCTEQISKNPKDYFHYKIRGDAFFLLGDFEKAIGDYSVAVRVKPDYVEAYLNRAYAEECIKDSSGAWNDFQVVIKLNPKEARAYMALGCISYTRGFYQKAASFHSIAIKDSANYSEAFYNRGLSYLELHNYDSSINDFMKIKRIASKSENVYINLARNYAGLKDYERAISYINKSLKLNSKNPSAYKFKALYQIEIGEFDEACGSLKQSYALGELNIYQLIEKYCK
jgi:tetratricopeptide (TPR) repeat protein